VKAKIQEISYKADMGNFRLVDENTSDNAVEDEFNEPIKINEIKLNDIVKVNIRTSQAIFYDLYAENKANGAFILIDSQTNATVAVGFLE
jgi:sulfate adenylyltransferase subunit 1